jgi:hypothetical protein
MQDYEPKGTRLILTNEKGFHLEIWKAVEDDNIHVWQSLYGNEDVYVMSMTRHQVADIIYKLETMLE